MALLDFQGTVRLKDINEDIVSVVVYFQDLDTNTVADVGNSFDVWVLRLDAVTDALVEQVKFEVVLGLPVGLKIDAGPQPIASGELATYGVTGFPTRSFGVFTPALDRTFISNGIPQATGLNATYLGSWLTAFGADNITLLSNLWLPLSRLRSLGLRTRKHRKQQDRVNLEVEPG